MLKGKVGQPYACLHILSRVIGNTTCVEITIIKAGYR